MSRTKKILVGAALGFAAGFAYALVQGPILYIPETTAGWLTFFFIMSIPWAALGALMGFLLSLKRLNDIRSERIQWKPLYLANPINWLKALWRLEPTMTVLLLISFLDVPMMLWDGVQPLAVLLLSAFSLVIWIILMFVVAGIKRAIVWLWRILLGAHKNERERDRGAEANRTTVVDATAR
jgi:hypothetical protein